MLVPLVPLCSIFWLIQLSCVCYIAPLVYSFPTYSAAMVDTASSTYQLLDRRACWFMFSYEERGVYSYVTAPAALLLSSYESVDDDVSGCSASVYTEVRGAKRDCSGVNRPTDTRVNVGVPGCAAFDTDPHRCHRIRRSVFLRVVAPEVYAGSPQREEEGAEGDQRLRPLPGAGLQTIGAAP